MSNITMGRPILGFALALMAATLPGCGVGNDVIRFGVVKTEGHFEGTNPVVLVAFDPTEAGSELAPFTEDKISRSRFCLGFLMANGRVLSNLRCFSGTVEGGSTTIFMRNPSEERAARFAAEVAGRPTSERNADDDPDYWATSDRDNEEWVTFKFKEGQVDPLPHYGSLSIQDTPLSFYDYQGMLHTGYWTYTKDTSDDDDEITTFNLVRSEITLNMRQPFEELKRSISDANPGISEEDLNIEVMLAYPDVRRIPSKTPLHCSQAGGPVVYGYKALAMTNCPGMTKFYKSEYQEYFQFSVQHLTAIEGL